MPISFISAASGTTTATLGSHQTGDLILVFAYRDGNTTAPSLPSSPTFNNIQASGANSNSARMAWRVATSSAETIGTWTNATTVIAVVYRGVNTETPIGGSAITGAQSTTVTYPGITMSVTDGSSWVVGAAGHRSTNTSLETPPSGLGSLRNNTVDATDEASFFDSNGGLTSWSNTNVSVGGTSSGWRAITAELIAAGNKAFNTTISESSAVAANLSVTENPNYVTTDWKSCSSTLGSGWTNLGNATASDNSYASCSAAASAETPYVYFTGFGFSIPTGATIVGIEYSIEGPL